MNDIVPQPKPPAKEAIRLCLMQLLADCMLNNMKVPALHIRLAILEIEQMEAAEKKSA